MTKLTIRQSGRTLKVLEKELNRVIKAMPAVMGQAAVSHFQENITKRQGVPAGDALQRFKPRVWENNGSSKGILNDTGNLVDSIKILSRSAKSVQVGIRASEIPYAELHQQGGAIPVTPKMRKFFWSQYYRHAPKENTARGKKNKVLGTRTTSSISPEAGFWKAMALKRRGAIIRIPKRQYMVLTPDLQKAILRAIQTEMDRIF
jgi:phage gpG-like protein